MGKEKTSFAKEEATKASSLRRKLQDLLDYSFLSPTELGVLAFLMYKYVKQPKQVIGWLCENGGIAFLCYLRSFLPAPQRIEILNDDGKETKMDKLKTFLRNVLICLTSNLIAEQGSVLLLHLFSRTVFKDIPFFSRAAVKRVPTTVSAYADWLDGNGYLHLLGGGFLLAAMESFQPKWTYDELSNTKFTWKGYIRHLCVIRIIVDIVFYGAHRAMHVYPWVYQMIHRRHHSHFKTSLATNMHFSAIDLFLESAFPLFTGMLVVRCILGEKMSRHELHTHLTNFAWFESGTHSGQPNPIISMIPPLSIFYNSILNLDAKTIEGHETHHNYRHCNYGITPWLDELFGTLRFHPQTPVYRPK